MALSSVIAPPLPAVVLVAAVVAVAPVVAGVEAAEEAVEAVVASGSVVALDAALAVVATGAAVVAAAAVVDDFEEDPHPAVTNPSTSNPDANLLELLIDLIPRLRPQSVTMPSPIPGKGKLDRI
jgi:hypothetical protein